MPEHNLGQTQKRLDMQNAKPFNPKEKHRGFTNNYKQGLAWLSTNKGNYMAWIDCNEELPFPGVKVLVQGSYTPAKYPKPLASIIIAPQEREQWGPWTSNEWRGMVHITHWWKDEGNPINQEKE